MACNIMLQKCIFPTTFWYYYSDNHLPSYDHNMWLSHFFSKISSKDYFSRVSNWAELRVTSEINPYTMQSIFLATESLQWVGINRGKIVQDPRSISVAERSEVTEQPKMLLAGMRKTMRTPSSASVPIPFFV